MSVDIDLREEALDSVRAHADGLFILGESSDYHKDRSFVREAVAHHGRALRYAHRFQNDREIVAIAVRQDGDALAHADVRLRADKEIVLIAVKEHGWAIGHASQELQQDRDVVMAAVAQCGAVLRCASAVLRADPEVVAVALNQDPSAQKYVAMIESSVQYTAHNAGCGHGHPIHDVTIEQLDDCEVRSRVHIPWNSLRCLLN